MRAARSGWSNRFDASGLQPRRRRTRSGCLRANRIARAVHRDSGCGHASRCGAATHCTLRRGAPSNWRRMDRQHSGSAQWPWWATAARHLRSASRGSTARRRTRGRSQDRPQLPLRLDREVGRPNGPNKLAIRANSRISPRSDPPASVRRTLVRVQPVSQIGTSAFSRAIARITTRDTSARERARDRDQLSPHRRVDMVEVCAPRPSQPAPSRGYPATIVMSILCANRSREVADRDARSPRIATRGAYQMGSSGTRGTPRGCRCWTGTQVPFK